MFKGYHTGRNAFKTFSISQVKEQEKKVTKTTVDMNIVIRMEILTKPMMLSCLLINLSHLYLLIQFLCHEHVRR